MEGTDRVTVSAGHAQLTLPAALYPIDAIHAAGYVFLDDHYVHLQAVEDGTTIDLELKDAPDDDAAEVRALNEAAGKFANEVLSQVVRGIVSRDRRPILQAIVGRAIAGAAGNAPTA